MVIHMSAGVGSVDNDRVHLKSGKAILGNQQICAITVLEAGVDNANVGSSSDTIC
jgi:hypothetical protein